MKIAQLIAGKTYQNKKGGRRCIRQITTPSTPFVVSEVFYIEEGSHVVSYTTAQEFAAWARSAAADLKDPYPVSKK
jgi:hypothetical protein